MNLRRIVVALLPLLLCLPLLAGGGRRRVERPAVFMVEGTITSVTATSISIRTPEGLSMTIGIAPTTGIERGMSAMPAGELQVASYVTVRAEQSPGGALTAIEIHVHSAPPDAAGSETVRISGIVASVAPLSMQLKTERGLVTVNADATTVVRRGGEQTTFDSIKAGEYAVVAGKVVGEATIFALAIDIILEPTPPPVPPMPMVYGQVSSITGSEIVVVMNPPDPRMGMPSRLITVIVDANTVIQKNGEPFPLSSIRAGDTIVAYGMFKDDHTLVASMIEILDPKPIGEVHGRVTEIKGDDLTVEPDGPMPMTMPSTIVRVSATTEIWRGTERIQLADIHVGDFLAAAGDWLDATTLAAKKIAILPPPPASVAGTVVAVGDRQLQVRVMRPAADSPLLVVRVDEKTQIFAAGVPIAFGDIKVGDELLVVGTRLADGTILAERIDVNRDPQPSWISGIVREVRASELVIDAGMPPMSSAALVIRVDDKTTITRDGSVIALRDVQIGDRVEASGTWIEPSVMLATKIAVMHEDPLPAAIFGSVVAINGFDLTVEAVYVGMTGPSPDAKLIVRATADTVVTNNGAPASFSAIVVGSYIRAVGTVTPERVLLAAVIDITEPPPPPVTYIEGSVAAVRDHEFDVVFPSFAYPPVTATVRVDEKTVIVKSGIIIPLSEIKVGDKAGAVGTWLSQGVFLASKVAVNLEVPPPIGFVSGQLVSIDGQTLAIRESATMATTVSVITTSETKFVRNGLPSRFSELRAGDIVEATGAWDQPRQLKAILVVAMTPRM